MLTFVLKFLWVNNSVQNGYYIQRPVAVEYRIPEMYYRYGPGVENWTLHMVPYYRYGPGVENWTLHRVPYRKSLGRGGEVWHPRNVMRLFFKTGHFRGLYGLNSEMVSLNCCSLKMPPDTF